MKIIDIRMRPPFAPYLGKNNLFDKDADNPFALSNFYSKFGMKMSKSMASAKMEDLLAEMDAIGEVIGVVSIRKNERGYENKYLLKLLADYPGRFIGACGIAADSSAETLDVIREYILDGPCKTVFMEPGFHGVMIDDPQIFGAYEFCEQHNIPMLVSFGGFHGPTDEFCLPSHADNVAMRFANLKICLCHAAWPWVVPAVRLAFKAPNVYLSPDIYALHVAGASDYIAAANHMLRKKIRGCYFRNLTGTDVAYLDA